MAADSAPAPQRLGPRLSWWRDLGTWARLSLAGVLAAGLLAIGLGWFIPREVETRFLEAQIESDQAVLGALTSTQALVAGGKPDITALDAFVNQAVLRGDFVRVKLWTVDGTIIYSDESALIGRTFAFETEDHADPLAGPTSHVSDLSHDENQYELGLGDSLLETYIPVVEDGETVAIWEVYHSLDRLNSAVAGVRWVTRVSVGAGLGILAVFLASAFGNLIATVQRRRREAETRSAELETLLDVARTTGGSFDTSQIAAETVRLLRDAGGYHCVALVRTGDTAEIEVLGLAGDASCIDKLQNAPESDCAPQRATAESENGLLMLIACRHESDHGMPTGPAVIEGAIEELRLGVDRAELYHHVETNRAQLKDVMERLVTAQEEERRRIVGEVHDGLGQDLHRVLFGIRGLMAATPDERDAELASLEAIVGQSSKRLRRLLHELHPSVIEDVGLAASLRGLAERMNEDYGLRVDLQIDEFPEPPLETRMPVFRIAQEAMLNIAKHADTLAGEVRVAGHNGDLVLRVADVGTGIDDEAHTGLGLWLMKERAESVGGTFNVTSSAAGTVIDVRVPLEERT
ncbi:MAG: ATP-binding protein [Acidimicrobiia bacterium]